MLLRESSRRLAIHEPVPLMNLGTQRLLRVLPLNGVFLTGIAIAVAPGCDGGEPAERFALTMGRIAERIVGAGPLRIVTSWPGEERERLEAEFLDWLDRNPIDPMPGPI